MATLRQKKAIKAIAENGGVVSKGMIEAGYSHQTAKTPQKLTDSDGWKELMEQHFNDSVLAEKHNELLNSTGLDHMTFALGPLDEKDKLEYIATAMATATKNKKEYVPIDYVTDSDIKDMLKSVNCTVRRIVHRETARDVYYWSPDNKSRKDALDMAYKLKGKYAPEKTITLNIEAKVDDVDLSLAQSLLDQRTKNLKGGSETSSPPSNGTVPVSVGGEVQDKK